MGHVLDQVYVQAGRPVLVYSLVNSIRPPSAVVSRILTVAA